MGDEFAICQTAPREACKATLGIDETVRSECEAKSAHEARRMGNRAEK